MSIKTYLKDHGRKLDFFMYQYLFEKDSPGVILKELSTYQNADGGFGNALEPDLRLPNSSVPATTVAFQYLSQIDVADGSKVVDRAIQYLVSTYDNSKGGWINLPPSADNYPRAPWWEYSSAKKSIEWGNPSAEVLGYLLKYADKKCNELVQELSKRAIRRLQKINTPEPHEIKCYLRLYENANQQLKKLIFKPLSNHIQQVAKIDPKDWRGYTATPITFITSPNSPFANLYDDTLLLENVQFLKAQIIDNSHWEPNWKWNQFEDVWSKAKQDWSGKITVDNLKILKDFGQVDELLST